MIAHVVECPVGYSCSVNISDWAGVALVGMFLLLFAFIIWRMTR